MSGAVQPVLATPDGTVIVGAARVTSPNLPAKNGVVHVIGNVLSSDAAVNSTGVAIAEKIGDFGPFNKTKVGTLLNVTGISALASIAAFALLCRATLIIKVRGVAILSSFGNQ